MKLGSRERALLGVITALVACAAFYILVLTPQNHQAAKLQSQIASAQTRLATAQQAYETGHAARLALAKDAPEYAASKIAVPQVSNVPAMLRLLQRSADQVGVSVQTISLASGSSGSAGATATATGATGTATSGPNAVPVALTFTGGYQALRRLVNRLDRYVVLSRNGMRANGPLFGIGNVSVNPGVSSSALTIQLTTNIYQSAAINVAAGASAGGS